MLSIQQVSEQLHYVKTCSSAKSIPACAAAVATAHVDLLTEADGDTGNGAAEKMQRSA